MWIGKPLTFKWCFLKYSNIFLMNLLYLQEKPKIARNHQPSPQVISHPEYSTSAIVILSRFGLPYYFGECKEKTGREKSYLVHPSCWWTQWCPLPGTTKLNCNCVTMFVAKGSKLMFMQVRWCSLYMSILLVRLSIPMQDVSDVCESHCSRGCRQRHVLECLFFLHMWLLR